VIFFFLIVGLILINDKNEINESWVEARMKRNKTNRTNYN